MNLLTEHLDDLPLLFLTPGLLSQASQVLDSIIIRGHSALSADLLDLGLVLREELLEDSEVLLMLEGHTSQQRVIVGGVLVAVIIPNEEKNHFLHVDFLVHLESASIDYLVDGGLVSASVRPVLADVLVDLIREFMAFLEARIVRADEDYAQVQDSKRNVDVQHVVLCAAWDADWSPSLAIRHRAEGHHEVKDHRHVYYKN